ncbi:hypothetical protein N9609_00640 [bacterium]|nr:hypothetical protein [bacterium]
MIKDNMKAKAGLLTLLIGMIGLVGFGATTADPVQNSIPDSIDCFDTEIVLVNVDVQMEFQISCLEDQIEFPIFSNSLEDADYSVFDYRSLEDPGLTISKKYDKAKHIITVAVLILPNEIRQRTDHLIRKNKSALKNQVESLGSKFLLPDIS